jgi:hypothetical protein
VTKVAKIAGPVLLFVSIPLDIMGIIAGMLERGKISEASKQIQKNIQELQNGQIKAVLNI